MNLQTKLFSGHSGGKSTYRNPCGPPKKPATIPVPAGTIGTLPLPHPWSYFCLPTTLHVGQGQPHLVMRRETRVPHPSSSRVGLAKAGTSPPAASIPGSCLSCSKPATLMEIPTQRNVHPPGSGCYLLFWGLFGDGFGSLTTDITWGHETWKHRSLRGNDRTTEKSPCLTKP